MNKKLLLQLLEENLDAISLVGDEKKELLEKAKDKVLDDKNEFIVKMYKGVIVPQKVINFTIEFSPKDEDESIYFKTVFQYDRGLGRCAFSFCDVGR